MKKNFLLFFLLTAIAEIQFASDNASHTKENYILQSETPNPHYFPGMQGEIPIDQPSNSTSEKTSQYHNDFV